MPINYGENPQRDITRLLGGPVAAGELYSNLLAKGEAHEGTPVSGSGGAGSGSSSAALGKLTGGETRAGTSPPSDEQTIRKALFSVRDLLRSNVRTYFHTDKRLKLVDDALAALDRMVADMRQAEQENAGGPSPASGGEGSFDGN